MTEFPRPRPGPSPDLCTQAIILCGGLGSRLRPIVGELPKVLAPVRGKPMLGHLLDQLVAQGVRHAVLAAGYRAELLTEAIGPRWKNLRITYSIEDSPRGTGGALRLAPPFVGDQPTFVMNGDTRAGMDLRDFGQKCAGSGAALGMALARVADADRYHAVECRDSRVHSIATGRTGPALVNCGTYWFQPALFSRLPARDQFSFEDDFLRSYVASEDVYGYTEVRDFIDMGTPGDYARCQTDNRFR